MLTWVVIQQGEGQIYESNPVARWFLTRGGWLGLTAFKLGSVALVTALALVIASYRARLGRLVLSFGCVSSLAVVVYSTSLAAGMEVGPGRAEWTVLRTLEADNLLLEGEHEGMRAYERLQWQLADQLRERHVSLPEAVIRLRATPQGRHERWLGGLRNCYPGLTDEQCVAANLVEFTLRTAALDTATSERLRRDFVTAYEMTWPSNPAAAVFDAAGDVFRLEIAEDLMPGARTECVPCDRIDTVADEAHRTVGE
jgi:hypothetical protein